MQTRHWLQKHAARRALHRQPEVATTGVKYRTNTIHTRTLQTALATPFFPALAASRTSDHLAVSVSFRTSTAPLLVMLELRRDLQHLWQWLYMYDTALVCVGESDHWHLRVSHDLRGRYCFDPRILVLSEFMVSDLTTKSRLTYDD